MSMRALGLGLVLVLAGCAGSHSPGDAEDAGLDAWEEVDDASLDAPVDCLALRVELRAELDRITSCTSDAECGMELDPRCGCAIDRVARRDADASAFDGLAARFRAECPGQRTVVLDRACVCHETIAPGFACVEGTCVHPIAAPDCTYDGAQFQLEDEFPSTDEINSCMCHPMPGGAMPGCTLLL
jgi:hypothetical protein